MSCGRKASLSIVCDRSASLLRPGVLLNPDVKHRILTPPDSYVDAAVLMAMQTADSYTGQLKTDAEAIRDLTDETTYSAIRP